MDYEPLDGHLPSAHSKHAVCIQREVAADGFPFGEDFTPTGQCNWDEFAWRRYVIVERPSPCSELNEADKVLRRDDHVHKCKRCRALADECNDDKKAVRLEPMVTDEHFAFYDSIAKAEPRYDEDFYSVDELRGDVATGRIRAWLAYDKGMFIGWSSVLVPSPHHIAPQASHMLGSIVVPSRRGQGYGTAMMRARIALFPDVPLTASCAPGNECSERVLRRHGFLPGTPQPPWITWHRPTRSYPMGLFRTQRALDAGLRSGAITYGEVFNGFRIDHRGRMWPDPAAFLYVDPELAPVLETVSCR